MVDHGKIVDAYVSVWNEADPAERRRRIAAVWAPEGTSCFRLLDARGHSEIEGRVTSSWEKWLSEGKYQFRSKTVDGHGNAIRCRFEMIRLEDGAVEANGLSFLLLDQSGKIVHDYQFNPSVDDVGDLANDYLGVLNEPDPGVRRKRIPILWAANTQVFTPDESVEGHAGVEDCIERLRSLARDPAHVFSPSGQSQRHHDVASFAWRVSVVGDGSFAMSGSSLLVFDGKGLIRRDYRFNDAT